MYLYGLVFRFRYRDIEEGFRISEVLRNALNLKDVPDYTTICKAVKKLRGEDLSKLLEERAKLLGFRLDYLQSILRALGKTTLVSTMPNDGVILNV